MDPVFFFNFFLLSGAVMLPFILTDARQAQPADVKTGPLN